MRRLRQIVWGLVGLAVLIFAGVWWHSYTKTAHVRSSLAQFLNQSVMPATVLSHPSPAPKFTLKDQFGQNISLAQFRGKVVVLAFADSQCTTVCPLTTVNMVRAKEALGAQAASQIQLLGVDANPTATQIADVRAYSQAHGMMHQWDFLTGSLAELQSVWKAYGVSVAIVHGAIDHTPALFVIGPRGNERVVFMTQMGYATVNQQTQLLANAIAQVLPYPTSQAQALLAVPLPPAPHLDPASAISLPVANSSVVGRTVTIGGNHPELVVFFNTWLDQFGSVSHQLQALNDYAQLAKAQGLPPVVAVDVEPTEPSPQSLPMMLKKTKPLDYPIGVDTTGAVADRLDVQDLTWYALIGAKGNILWSYDGSNHWLSLAALRQSVKKAMHPSARSSPAKTGT